jgi:hypothetical protein
MSIPLVRFLFWIIFVFLLHILRGFKKTIQLSSQNDAFLMRKLSISWSILYCSALRVCMWMRQSHMFIHECGVEIGVDCSTFWFFQLSFMQYKRNRRKQKERFSDESSNDGHWSGKHLFFFFRINHVLHCWSTMLLKWSVSFLMLFFWPTCLFSIFFLIVIVCQ